MKLTELIEAKDAPRIYTNRGAVADIPDVEVFSLSCNSREDLKDAIFVALKGTQSDGHAYIRDALRRGARAIVFEDSRRIASLINGDEKDVSQAVFIQVADSKKPSFRWRKNLRPSVKTSDYYRHYRHQRQDNCVIPY